MTAFPTTPGAGQTGATEYEPLVLHLGREEFGKIVRAVWVAYCRETGDTRPSHIAPWEELGEWDKEADRRIGEAVATLVATPRLPPGQIITDAARVPSAAVISAIKATRDFASNFRSSYPEFDPKIGGYLASLDAYLAGVTDGE